MKFPQKLYVKKQQDGSETYYVADTDWADLAESDNGTIEAAVYELREVGKLSTSTTFASSSKVVTPITGRVKVGRAK